MELDERDTESIYGGPDYSLKLALMFFCYIMVHVTPYTFPTRRPFQLTLLPFFSVFNLV